MKIDYTNNRRKLLSGVTKGTSLVVAKSWVAPAILSVALPVHAQSSATKAPTTTEAPPQRICAPDMSTSDSRDRIVVQPDINRNWTFDQYDPQEGTISKALLVYNYTMGTDFNVRNTDSDETEFTVETIATFIMTTPKAGQNKRDDLERLPEIFRADRVTAAETVTVTRGNNKRIFGLEVTVSGQIDLLAAGIDPSVFVGNGQLQINYNVERFSTVVRPMDKQPIRIARDAYFMGDATINYSCTL